MADGRPEPVGSGLFRRVGPPRREFPNNVELVANETHADLLKALLPALRRYNCLEIQEANPSSRRSPWVRAFCDLYHPAGPWGGNTFFNVHQITSEARYRFRSYQVPKIYEILQRNPQQNPVHKELLAALHPFFSQDQYIKDCIAAAKAKAVRQLNKEARGGHEEAVRVSAEQLVAEITNVPLPPACSVSTPVASRPSAMITPPQQQRETANNENTETPVAAAAAAAATKSASDAATGGTKRKRAPKDSEKPIKTRRCRRRLVDQDNAKSSLKPKAAWICKACTFLNQHSEYLSCEICQTDRDMNNLKKAAQDKEHDDLSFHDDNGEVPAEAGDDDDPTTPQKPAALETSKQSFRNEEDTSDPTKEITDDEDSSSRKADSASNLLRENDADKTEATATTATATTPATFASSSPDMTTPTTTTNQVTPSAVKSQEEATSADFRLVAIQTKREKLADLLQLRQGSGDESSKMDPLSQKIQKAIDQLDNELFELILQQ